MGYFLLYRLFSMFSAVSLFLLDVFEIISRSFMLKKLPQNPCNWIKNLYNVFFVCFFFTFIEHKNFWQNAKSKYVFLLPSVIIQYLHRWQRADTQRSGSLLTSDLQYELWISDSDQLLAVEAWRSCLTEYEAGCYTDLS